MSGIRDRISSQSTLGLVLTGPSGEVKVNKQVDQHGETLTNEFVITKEFNSANEFSAWVLAQSRLDRIGCMDTIINYCTEKDIDIEAVAPLINQVLKERIRLEAEEANLMKRSARL
ncbi:hypothetical protein EBT31_21370, partial [bacterium]|nr:hypothetical protein [bacterium]